MVLNEKQQRDIPNKQNKTAITKNHIQHSQRIESAIFIERKREREIAVKHSTQLLLLHEHLFYNTYATSQNDSNKRMNSIIADK